MGQCLSTNKPRPVEIFGVFRERKQINLAPGDDEKKELKAKEQAKNMVFYGVKR